MARVQLPYVEPIYSTYHWMSNAGIPVKQNPTSDNWFYNNTVDWECTREFLHGYGSPKISIQAGSIWDVHLINESGINIRFTQSCAIELIKDIIDEGYYVVFNGIDDYYIKGKSWYKEHHFYHDGLIIGYDDEKETLIIAAYDQRWIFSVFDTPQKGFMRGLKASCDNAFYGSIHAVKANDIVQELDLTQIYESIKKYLSSEINSYSLNDLGKVNGIVIYDFICMYLDKLLDGSISYERRDRRVFRMIWEHKKCMLSRIKAVEDKCGWGDGLSREYTKVVYISDQIRFIYSKFAIKFSENNVENIQSRLMNIKRLEQDLLSRFECKLDRELNCVGN